MKTVYIETSVVSYLTARPSRDLVAAAHQQITQEWWFTKRSRFRVYISQLVVEEAAEGDQQAAGRRLAALEDIEELEITPETRALAGKFMREGSLPMAAADDAAHIAIAAVHNIDYLVTWNCRHMDNPEIKPLLRGICASNGYRCPEICGPEELTGDWLHEN